MSAHGRLLCFLFMFGFGVLSVGTFAPYWSLSEGFHSGIWMSCNEEKCTSFHENHTEDTLPWLRVVQLMAIWGVLASLFGSFLAVVCLITGDKSLLGAIAVTAIIAGVEVIAGVIVYFLYNPQSLCWAFWFEVTAGCVILFAGIGHFIQVCIKGKIVQ